MIVLLENECDYLMTIGEKRKLIPLPRSGRRLEEDIDIRLVELYKINEEIFRKGYRMTLIPADYEVYPKDSVVYIAKAEVVDESFKYDSNGHRLLPVKKEVYLTYRNREYLMIRKKNEATLIYNSLYGDAYATMKTDEVDIDNEMFFEMLIRYRFGCCLRINDVVVYLDPKRMNFYKHTYIPITLATEARIVEGILLPDKKENRKILFIHGTRKDTSRNNEFYTIHSEKIQIHNDNPKLVLSYTGEKTIDITGMEDERLL